MTRWSGWRRVVMVLLAAAAIWCSGSETASPVTSTTLGVDNGADQPPSESDSVEVLDSYRAYWDAVLEASDPPDPSSAALTAHATGQALEDAVSMLAAQAEFGEAVRGEFNLDPAVSGIDGEQAGIDDCWTPDTAVFDRESGDLKFEPPAIARRLVVELLLEGAVWKVSRITDEGPCSEAPPRPGDSSG